MSELRWILLVFGIVLLAGIFLWGRRSRGQAAAPSEVVTAPHVDGTANMPPIAAPDDTPPVASRWQEDEWTSTVTDLPEIRLDASHAFDDPLEPALGDDEPVLPPEDIMAAEEVPLESAGSAAPVEEGRRTGSTSYQDGAAPKSRSGAAPEKRKIVALRLSAPAHQQYDGAELHAALRSAGLTHGKYGIFHCLSGSGSVFSVASMVEPGAFDLATMDQTHFAGVTLFALLPGPVPAAAAYDQMVACARQLEQTLGGELHDERGLPMTPQRAALLRDDVLNFEHLLGAVAPTHG